MTEESERLRQARVAEGFPTAAEAARRLGIDYPTYAGHENGTRGFNKDQALEYATAFRINVLWLLYGLGDPSGPNMEQELLALPPEQQKQVLEYLDYIKSKVGPGKGHNPAIRPNFRRDGHKE